MCDTPGCMHEDGMSHEQILAAYRRNIKQFGWVVSSAPGAPRAEAYTVGLTAKRYPELYVITDAPATVRVMNALTGVLNAIAQNLLDQRTRPKHGDTLAVDDQAGSTWTCKLDVRLDRTPLIYARALYGAKVSAIEVTLLQRVNADGHVMPDLGLVSGPDIEQTIAAVLSGQRQTAVFTTAAELDDWIRRVDRRAEEDDLDIRIGYEPSHCFAVVYRADMEPTEDEQDELAESLSAEHHVLSGDAHLFG